MFKEFTVKDVFDVSPVNRITEPNKSYIPDDEIIGQGGNTPYIAAISKNNGITGYSYREPNNMGDCVTLSTTAASPDTVFYQPDAFIGRQQMSAFRRKDGNPLGYGCGIYLVTLVRKLTIGFNYGNKLTNDFLKNMTISLPVIENPNPDHEYTVDDIDWQYMRDRITELERDRITELERDRITELDAYLQATGLNDYELTEEDKKILSLSTKRASDENRTLEDNSEDEVRFGKFDISDIYEVQKVQHKLDKSQIASEGNYPCFSSDTTNNGILGYTDNPEFHISDKTKVYIIFGDHTRTFDIATTDFSVLDNVKVLKPVTNNIKALQYINSVWGKSIPNLGYARHWSVAKDKKLSLPIKSDRTPDFDYMERYIRAMEKVVIADVVKYKDKVIEETRKVVGE